MYLMFVAMYVLYSLSCALHISNVMMALSKLVAEEDKQRWYAEYKRLFKLRMDMRVQNS